MKSKYDLKQRIYVPFEIYAISYIVSGDKERVIYQVRGVDDKGVTLTMTEEDVQKYWHELPRIGEHNG